MTDRVKEFLVYIGQPVRVLVDFARSKNMIVRHLYIDGSPQLITHDSRSDRINISSDNGIVTSVGGIY